ncbi:MAG: Trk system potassium transporter TrkA [candidate division Zixibacteria bacterium]|nr:Trk system potassium transporter TrkA [candidate division Zixibacteria bacterium]
MRIIIVGGGVVGYSLADQLLRDKHELSLIEADPELCEEISQKLDVQILTGSGTSPSLLREAGLPQAEMVLAVTPNDEVNLLVCAIAAQYDVKSRIARLRSSEFAEGSDIIDLHKLGVTSIIYPEKVLADHIMQFVETPHTLESANFEHGRILMRGFKVTENMELANRTPRQIRADISPIIILFSTLIRNGEGVIPDGETLIKPGDTLFALFPRESLDRFRKLVGIEKKNRKIIITGNSYATIELAKALDKTDYQVSFVDPDAEHANRAAALLSNIDVLHGSCTEPDLLRELNIDNASFFIAVSDEADYNMLSALLAKAEGAHEAIATTTESLHDKLFHSFGIDHVINPRLTTARAILDIISRGHIGAVVKLSDVDIEAVRFNVHDNSDAAGMKVKNIATKMKKGSIIGVIVREDRMILPEGETVIEAGDHVIVITHHRNLSTISRLFRPRRMF